MFRLTDKIFSERQAALIGALTQTADFFLGLSLLAHLQVVYENTKTNTEMIRDLRETHAKYTLF